MSAAEDFLQKIAVELVSASNKAVDSILHKEIAEIVKLHAGIAVGAAAIPIPGLDMVAAATNIWIMYGRINKVISIPFCKNVMKSIASGIAANLFSALSIQVVASGIKLIPGVGSAVGFATLAATLYPITIAAGVIYMKALTSMLKKKSEFTELNLKSEIDSVLNDKESIKKVLGEAKNEYDKAKVSGELNNEEGTNGKPLSEKKLREIQMLKEAHEKGFFSIRDLEKEIEKITQIKNIKNPEIEPYKSCKINKNLGFINISRGQRIKLKEIVSDNKKFEIFSNISSPGLMIDFVCFGLDMNSQLSDDRYMVFFNQPSTPCGGITINILENNTAKFLIDFNKLPKKINQLVFTVSVDGSAIMSQIKNSHIGFITNKNETARFSFSGSDFSEERALILLTIYLKQNEWRTSAIGQGFYGGLEQLVHHFGGTTI